MTSQQLIEARAALWHHNAEPILTVEDAASWLATTGFLLFLPRRQQLRAPGPTFVEACMGRLEHMPARPEIENALNLAHRLFATGEVLPLNLLGTLNEEPDFLIARDRLPWLFALRGDRSWKSAPGGRTSPLNVSVWKLLDEQGELTTEQIRSGVGRDVSEASVRRALIDLWGTLRVFPRYHDGETTWVLAKASCPRECAKGASTSQGAALSLFLADYLRSVIAATEDEISSFLSPLASRSRLREVLHALVATRQLSTIPLGPNTLYHVTGEMPEFPEASAPETAIHPGAQTEPGSHNVPEHPSGAPAHEPHERIHRYAPRPEHRHEHGPEHRAGHRPDTRQREQRPDRREPRSDRRPPQRDHRDRGFRDRQPGGFRPPTRKPRPQRKPDSSENEQRSERPRRAAGQDRPPFRKSGFGKHSHKPFGRKFSDRKEDKPYRDRKREDFRSRNDRSNDRNNDRDDDRNHRDRQSRQDHQDRPSSRRGYRPSGRSHDNPRRESGPSDRPSRKTYGKERKFSGPGGKSRGKGTGEPAGRDDRKPYGKGPGKKTGKSGFTRGPGKSYGKKFSKGPGKGPSKGTFHGSGKPRRRPE